MEKELRNKITALFEYRQLPELISYLGDERKEKKLIENLIELQIAIYNLDHYLESNWLISEAGLEPYWQRINEILREDFDVALSQIPDHIDEILTYQKHELNLRKRELPITLDPIHFYFFKSCDVKLSRKLIYQRIPALQDIYSLEDWKAFDLITELNDDIEDIFEDLDTINGNAVLIAAQSEGLSYAKEYAIKIIQSIEQIESKNDDINKLTKTNIEKTKVLLDKQITAMEENLEQIENSRLLKLLEMSIH